MYSIDFRPPRKPTKPCIMGLRFLDFPPELRLDIYRVIYLDNLLDRGPSILRGPNQKPTVRIVTAKARGGADAGGASGAGAGATSSGSSSSALLDHNRKVGRLPTALLRTCKKIYLEARVVPFNESGFWCGHHAYPGLMTGRAFFERLAPWQRDATRFVVLDIFNYSELRGLTPAREESIRQRLLRRRRGGEGRHPRSGSRDGYGYSNEPDLVADSVHALEEVCGYWSAGVQNLRLRITTAPGPMYFPVAGSDDHFLEQLSNTPQHRSTLPPAKEWLLLEPVVTDETTTTRQLPWIDVALRRLRALRRLEVELLEMARLSPADKVTWCARLEEMLNLHEERQHRVAVVPVEETMLRKPREMDETWSW
ncbi:hypothetical protein MAPG_06996 [Magnaporthiopsis poae ATCC 64411]|uniref:Uncharacterized protein n=1 Tax=Magnaporthiopsis poae (strain ATCC 64411 / 73-15) TaxID=644358 RepID=A0A0C4E3J4_MAGP6|nr:hypothetical protein MAPG_06996 [Magnaporthiopsis poae ATCC 64411]